MLTIIDYTTIAQIANQALAEEYAMHALAIDPPIITPAMVRLIVSETNRYNASQAAAAKPQPPKTVPKPARAERSERIPKPAPSTPAPDEAAPPFHEPDDTYLLDLIRQYSHNGVMFSAAMFDQVKPADAPNMAAILYQLGSTMPHLAKRAGLQYNPHHWKGAKRDEALAAFGSEPAKKVAEKIDEQPSKPGPAMAKEQATKVAEHETRRARPVARKLGNSQFELEPETEGYGGEQTDAFFRNGA